MSFLFNQKPIVIDVNLAVKLGTNEAIVLQQINYWIEINKKANRNYEDGRYWTYNTIKDWHDELPFMAEKTIKRTIDGLKSRGILITDNFNKKKFDRTLWYTINFDALDDLFKEENSQLDSPKQENALGQDDQMEEDNLTTPIGQNDSMEEDNLTQPIPEISKEISTKTNTETNIHTGSCENSSPKKSKDQIEQTFIDYSKGDEELLQALNEFAKMRKAIKSPLSTERAAKMLLNNLDSLATSAVHKIAILNQSILSNWKGVFALKNSANNTVYTGNGYSVESSSQGTNGFDRVRSKYGGD